MTAPLLQFGLLDRARAIVSVPVDLLAVFWALLLTGLYTFASRLV